MEQRVLLALMSMPGSICVLLLRRPLLDCVRLWPYIFLSSSSLVKDPSVLIFFVMVTLRYHYLLVTFVFVSSAVLDVLSFTSMLVFE